MKDNGVKAEEIVETFEAYKRQKRDTEYDEQAMSYKIAHNFLENFQKFLEYSRTF